MFGKLKELQEKVVRHLAVNSTYLAVAALAELAAELADQCTDIWERISALEALIVKAGGTREELGRVALERFELLDGRISEQHRLAAKEVHQRSQVTRNHEAAIGRLERRVAELEGQVADNERDIRRAR